MSMRPIHRSTRSLLPACGILAPFSRLGALLALATILACGGGGGGGSDAKLTLSPATATVRVAGELPFIAALSDGSKPKLVWSLDRPAMGGVSPGGTFLAGHTPGQVVLTVRTADGSTSANATIDIPTPAAGEGLQLFSGAIPGAGLADGIGPAAILSFPRSLTCLPSGEVFFTDAGAHTLRKITPDGHVTTLAGRPASMVGYADGTGWGARFQAPRGITSDASGNLYVVDSGNTRIRKVLPTGEVTTLAGSDNAQLVDGTGTSAGLERPGEIAWSNSGLLYFTDKNAIRSLTSSGTVTTLVRNLSGPQGLCIAPNGDIIFIDAVPGGNGYDLKKLSPGGTLTTLSWAGAKPNLPYAQGLALAGDGSLFLSDGSSVYRRAPDGTASLYASGSGTALWAGHIEGIAVDAQGNLWLADSHYHALRKVSPDGTDSIVAGCAPWSQATDGTAQQARFGSYAGLSGGNIGQMAAGPGTTLYVLDPTNHSVRKVDAAGTVSTLAILGDPVFSTVTPLAIALDGGGNAYISTWDNSIWLVTADGIASLFAGSPNSVTQQNGPRLQASFLQAWGLALADGLLYVGDQNCIRTISLSTGLVSTLAGSFGYASGLPADGSGAVATFHSPSSMATGPDGNIYLIDSSLIRKVTPSGTVTTISGDYYGGFQDGPATQAKFMQPSQMAFDPQGNLLIVDRSNFVVRQLDPTGKVSSLFGSRNGGDVVLGPYPGGLGFQGYGIAITSDGTIFLSIASGIVKAGRPH